MESFTVACYQLRALCSALEALGLDVDALAREAGIDSSVLADVDARFPELSLLRLWSAAEQRWTSDLLSLRAGSRVPFGALELMDYLVASSPTVGEAFERLARYSRLCASGLTYRIAQRSDDDDDGFVITMHHPFALELWPPSVVEYLWTLIVARFRAQVGDGFRATLRLKHAPRAAVEQYRRALGSVLFEQPQTGLYVSHALWSAENPRADRSLTHLLERYAEEVLARLPASDDPLEAARRELSDGLRAGDASIERVAKRLSLTPRTLQRKLAELGHSFRSLLDQVRDELARGYLEQNRLSLTEITYLLGYSDPSAFNRAFRRWNDCTPAEYRARQAGADSTRFLWRTG